jgi:ElaB/YqjD/DUF883 family membrane-anchored ribosome-binding protein
MKENIMKDTLQTGARIAQLGQEASRVKGVVTDAVSEAVEDGVTAARRAAKKGYYAAEDFMDETAYRVKRNPFGAVAIAFGAGALVGLLLSRLLKK